MITVGSASEQVGDNRPLPLTSFSIVRGMHARKCWSTCTDGKLTLGKVAENSRVWRSPTRGMSSPSTMRRICNPVTGIISMCAAS